MYLERVYLLSTICLPKVHAALWVLTRESRRTWWHMTPNSRHLGEQYAATGAVKDVAGVKTTWIKCIRIPRFVGSSSWSSLGKKWKRNTWRLFLSPKFAQTSETSDLARRIGAVAMLPTHAKQMAAHIELVEEYFWAVSSWMSCISESMCRVSECFHLWPWPVFFSLPFAPLQIRQIIGELCDRLYEAQYGAEAEEKRFTLAQFYVSYRYNYTSTFNSRRFTEQKPGRFNLSWVLCWWTFLFRSGENKQSPWIVWH